MLVLSISVDNPEPTSVGFSTAGHVHFTAAAIEPSPDQLGESEPFQVC